jgi:hypothetical protein
VIARFNVSTIRSISPWVMTRDGNTVRERHAVREMNETSEPSCRA